MAVDAAQGTADPNSVSGAEGIFINGSNNEVAYNSFVNCSSTAAWTSGNCDGGATEVTVGAGATLSGVKVHHNFSYNSCGFFEVSSGGSSKGTFSDSEFYYNVSIDSGWLMLLQVNNTNLSNIRWENNTIVQHSGSSSAGMLTTIFTGTSSGQTGGGAPSATGGKASAGGASTVSTGGSLVAAGGTASGTGGAAIVAPSGGVSATGGAVAITGGSPGSVTTGGAIGAGGIAAAGGVANTAGGIANAAGGIASLGGQTGAKTGVGGTSVVASATAGSGNASTADNVGACSCSTVGRRSQWSSAALFALLVLGLRRRRLGATHTQNC